jgi:hypothetical protein
MMRLHQPYLIVENPIVYIMDACAPCDSVLWKPGEREWETRSLRSPNGQLNHTSKSSRSEVESIPCTFGTNRILLPTYPNTLSLPIVHDDTHKENIT